VTSVGAAAAALLLLLLPCSVVQDVLESGWALNLKG
jgi:hypothetical protein